MKTQLDVGLERLDQSLCERPNNCRVFPEIGDGSAVALDVSQKWGETMGGFKIELGFLVHYFQWVFEFLGVPSLHTHPSCDTCDTFAPAAGHLTPRQ